MKKKFLVLTVVVFTICAHAQNRAQYENEEWKSAQNEITNFDIGKFITPNIVRNQLGINFDFRSDNTRFDESYPDKDSRKESSKVSGNLTSTFNRYVNTRKTISNLLGYLSLEVNKNAQKNQQTFTTGYPTVVDNESNLSQRNSFQLLWTNQWYFSKLLYLDYGFTNTTLRYIYNQDKTKKQTEDTNKENKYLGFNISPQVGIGYGRIENVRDARHAVYITQALSKKNVLTRQLSNDEMFELSQKISSVKNKRFLDSRLRLIEEITTVDSFFVNNNLLADNGASYFTTLNDMWQYGDLFSRQSGFNISFRVDPYFSALNTKDTPVKQDNFHFTKSPTLSVTFRYEKPFKLNWQHSILTDAYGSIHSTSSRYKGIDHDLTNNTEGKTISAYAKYALGYYPNTRTNIQVSATQRISEYKSESTFNGKRNGTDFYSDLNAALYYYFSPNLRLSGNFRFYYFYGDVDEFYPRKDNYLSTLFYVQLTYYIF